MKQIHATLAELRAERHPDADEDVHFTRGLARTIIEAYSAPGDLVLDPFAGFGTTAEMAHELGRRAIAVELLPERVATIRTRVPDAIVVEGDARGLRHLVANGELPIAPGSVTLALTSPPFMTANAHPANPLTAYETDDGDYRTYLDHLAQVAASVGALLRPGGHFALDVADIEHEGHHTPLIADVADAISAVLPLVAEIPVIWDELPYDLTDNRVLIFAAPHHTTPGTTTM